MLSTLTNLFIFPLIYKSYSKELYVDLMVFISTFVGSFLFHLQEEFDKGMWMPYWHWLIFDHYYAMLMVVVVLCHVAGFRKLTKLSIIYITGFIELFLNLLILHKQDGELLDVKNFFFGGMYFALIIPLNFEHIKLNNIEKVYFFISYILIFVFAALFPLEVEYRHPLWHMGIFLNTWFLYHQIAKHDYQDATFVV